MTGGGAMARLASLLFAIASCLAIGSAAQRVANMRNLRIVYLPSSDLMFDGAALLLLFVIAALLFDARRRV